ncbi:hypothetical protein BC628DRAFT_1342792 [Trametes gibbosa]|nr:hypothetical protein BC628DRAFT_1342792 [Trametes gibbosa]
MAARSCGDFVCSRSLIGICTCTRSCRLIATVHGTVSHGHTDTQTHARPSTCPSVPSARPSGHICFPESI